MILPWTTSRAGLAGLAVGGKTSPWSGGGKTQGERGGDREASKDPTDRRGDCHEFHLMGPLESGFEFQRLIFYVPSFHGDIASTLFQFKLLCGQNEPE